MNERVDAELRLSTDFYSLLCKNYHKDNISYGRKTVDFQNGSLICMAPNQVLTIDSDAERRMKQKAGVYFFILTL